MLVAAYQAPYLPFGSLDAIELIATQQHACVERGIEILCCPEGVVGGLAHESDGQSPDDVALGVADGELAAVLAPLLHRDGALTTIVGFTERDPDGHLFNSAAVLQAGAITAIYRKVFPGYRTIIQAGTELPVLVHGDTPFGIVICNDLWYVEPARVLATRGAAILFVPTNSGHARSVEAAEALRPRGDNLPVARAVENTMTVVTADIAGEEGGRRAIGCTRIVDPDGVVLASADPHAPELVVADVEARRRPFDPRGWDGHQNPSVSEAFVSLWTDPDL